MTGEKIAAIILISLIGCALILGLSLFAWFIARSIKENPAEKWLVGVVVFVALIVLAAIGAMITALLFG